MQAAASISRTRTKETPASKPGSNDGLAPGSVNDLVAPGSVDDPVTPGSVDDLVTPGSVDDLVAPGSVDDLVAPGSVDGLVAPGSVDGLVAPGSVDELSPSAHIQTDLLADIPKIRSVLTSIHALQHISAHESMRLLHFLLECLPK